MKTWIISICAISILSLIIIFILPKNKINELIKKILLLIFSITIILPIFKIKDFNFFNYITTDSLSITNEEKVDINLINYIYDKKIENYKKNINEKLMNLGINKSEIEIQYSINENYAFDILCVEINLKKAELNKTSEHIVTNEEIIKCIKDVVNQNVNCKIYD